MDALTESEAGASPWVLRRRVLPQHTDLGGVMWHGAYVAWLEEARVEALAAAGLPYGLLAERGLELPVVQLAIEYRQTLAHGLWVELHSWLLPARGLRLPWCSRFVLSDGTVAAEARVELVLVELSPRDGRRRLLRRPPADLREALATLARGPAQP